MTIHGIISALIIGAIVGALARLILPGKQSISVVVTVLVGIVAAFLGTALANALGVPTSTAGVDWRELACQLVLAVVGVALVAGLMGRGHTRRRRPLTR